jgi:diphthamide biosynthesis protein 4
MEWTRACRCGMEKGYTILEEELEDAEQRGEGEVLVGCEGCSLWVRVGFGVEDLDD